MSDVPRDPVLDLLHDIRADVAEVRSDLAEVKERLGILVLQGASLSRRIGGDMAAVKRHLHLVEA